MIKEAESKSEILISNEVEKNPDEIKRQNSSGTGETAHDEHKEAETSAALVDKHSSEGASMKINLKNDCLRAEEKVISEQQTSEEHEWNDTSLGQKQKNENGLNMQHNMFRKNYGPFQTR